MKGKLLIDHAFDPDGNLYLHTYVNERIISTHIRSYDLDIYFDYDDNKIPGITFRGAFVKDNNHGMTMTRRYIEDYSMEFNRDFPGILMTIERALKNGKFEYKGRSRRI